MAEVIPRALTERVGDITEMLANKLGGMDKLPHPVTGWSAPMFVTISATMEDSINGHYIDVRVTDFNHPPDGVRLFVHISDPVLEAKETAHAGDPQHTQRSDTDPLTYR